MKNKFIILFLFIPLISYAQDFLTTQHMTLEELFELGLKNSKNIQIGKTKLIVAENETNLAKNKRLPSVIVNGTYGYVGQPVVLNKNLGFISHPESTRWKQNYQLTVTQPLFQGGKIINNIDKARLTQQIAELSIKKDKSELKIWLTGKYLDLVSLFKQRKAYIQNIQEANRRHHDILQMKKNGMITANDVLRSQLAIVNSELALKHVDNNIRIISQEIDIITGLDELYLIEPDSTILNRKFQINSETTYLTQAKSNYPDLQIAQMNIDYSKIDLKQVKSDLWPTLSLQAGNTLVRPIPNSSPMQDLFLNSWAVTLNLSYNISTWFDKKHNIQLAKQQIHIQQLAEDQQEQSIRIAISSAYINHEEALERISAMDVSLLQAQENYRIVKNKYFNKLAILTDLLDANSILLDTELQMCNAQAEAVYTYYQLQKVSGNL